MLAMVSRKILHSRRERRKREREIEESEREHTVCSIVFQEIEFRTNQYQNGPKTNTATVEQMLNEREPIEKNILNLVHLLVRSFVHSHQCKLKFYG